jgi:molybdate transport system substrate-binding protein
VTHVTTLNILSAGAAKAVVLALAGELQSSAINVTATFDAAGAILARFRAGDACDVLILPAAMQQALAAQGRIEIASIAALGRVPTGIAVPDGAPTPSIVDPDALRESLVRASVLYCPDTERATAGIHFLRMLRTMGIAERVAARMRPHANGAQAMAALAADGAGAIGCTQITEILYTPGVALVGPLPAPFTLSTLYSVAVAAASSDSRRAREFAARLAGDATRAQRETSGFLAPESTSDVSER